MLSNILRDTINLKDFYGATDFRSAGPCRVVSPVLYFMLEHQKSTFQN